MSLLIACQFAIAENRFAGRQTMKMVLGLVAGLVMACASPASAALSFVPGACLSAASCVFRGTVSTSPTTLSKTGYLDAQDLFNAAHPGDPITLQFITSANDSDFNSDFGSITGGGLTKGSWMLDGFAVDFIAVESPGYTALSSVGGTSSGDWNTDAIPFSGGLGSSKLETNILFFGSVIGEGGGTALPEPSTWAMFLAGLFGLGVLMRSRGAIARGKLLHHLVPSLTAATLS
jgi:hypothetical protein